MHKSVRLVYRPLKKVLVMLSVTAAFDPSIEENSRPPVIRSKARKLLLVPAKSRFLAAALQKLDEELMWNQ